MSAVIGVLIALPQSIQSAKELYDLRSRYKDASVLITAIYSESMVVAASLSQVQNLLQHDALREKPQLFETFDRALTGCRVVYGCLEEEVRELRVKAENDDLNFKDRARFLWKEDTFKELLTQIRGQQSALTLLIQGLQMESIADIKKLVQENSVTLDQVVKRSRTLRQSHPRLKVPESLFSRQSLGGNEGDADSIAKATEFTFDDEVVNSKAYRRAMAMALSTSHNRINASEDPDTTAPEDDSTVLGILSHGNYQDKSVDPINLSKSLERDKSSFMPQTSSTTIFLTPNHTGSEKSSALPSHPTGSLTPAPLRSFSENKEANDSDAPPPLPPRRASEQHVVTPQMRSVSSDNSKTVRDTNDVTAPGALLLLHNIEMNNIWRSLVDAERKFIDRLVRLKRMFYDNITRQWPILEKHLDAILIGEQLATIHQQYLLQAMDQELASNGNGLCNPDIFEVWVGKSHQLYREYCRKMPHAFSSLQTTQNLDPKFTPFVNTLGLSIAYFGKSWQDYLELPNMQLQKYVDSLQSLINFAETLDNPAGRKKVMRLRRALQAVTWLKTSILALLEEAQAREDVQNLEKCIRTDFGTLSQLRLHEPIRRVIHQGGIAMKLKSNGPWISVHAILLDHYFLWGKAKKSKGNEVLVMDAPIAVADMELSLPADAPQFQKATMLDQIARGSVVYIIKITNKAQEGKPSLLGLYDFKERKVWLDHFTTAQTKFYK